MSYVDVCGHFPGKECCWLSFSIPQIFKYLSVPGTVLGTRGTAMSRCTQALPVLTDPRGRGPAHRQQKSDALENG